MNKKIGIAFKTSKTKTKINLILETDEDDNMTLSINTNDDGPYPNRVDIFNLDYIDMTRLRDCITAIIKKKKE